MGNLVITNNGSSEIPAVLDADGNVVTPAIPADPTIYYTVGGETIAIAPGQCVGLDYPTNATITGA